MFRIIFLFRMGKGGGMTERHYLGHKGSHQGGIREEVLEVFFSLFCRFVPILHPPHAKGALLFAG